MRAIGIIILALILTCNIATAQDTLYIYKSGMVVSKRAVAQIDSVIFYRSGTAPLGITDIDGNVYHTVTIGTQVWMVENLKTTKYRNGDPISNVTNDEQWMNLSTGAQCNYLNDVAMGNKFGKLYNWFAVADSRNIAPIGWHIPDDEEWETLENYVSANLGTSGSVAKALANKTDWASSASAGAVGNDATKNNTSGFTALPSGLRGGKEGNYKNIGSNGYWWSSTEYYDYYSNLNNNYYAWSRNLDYDKSNLSRIYIYDYAGKECGFSVRCVKYDLSIVTTSAANNITLTSAICGGNISNDGDLSVTERGVCYSKYHTPTTSDNKMSMGSGTGIFSNTVTGLTPNTTYYMRAYATNSVFTKYGNEISFKTFTETVTDIDGNVYNAVTIGNQVWMVENLKTTKYNDGTSIPNVTDGTAWGNLTTPGYCWYSNDIVNKNTYGALYNWHTVNTGKLCPKGWHVPTDAEWTTLENYVSANLGTSGSVAKALASNTDWASTTSAGTVGNDLTKNNTSGFTALPGGGRYGDGPSGDGAFGNIGGIGYWWSSTEGDAGYAWHRVLYDNGSNVVRSNYYKEGGFSVRCVRD